MNLTYANNVQYAAVIGTLHKNQNGVNVIDLWYSFVTGVQEVSYVRIFIEGSIKGFK